MPKHAVNREQALEIKVGALLLLALGILGAFVFVIAGVRLERTFTLYVDFDNPGGLQGGAQVRIAGVRVGTVSELQFLGGKVDPRIGRRVLVRAKLTVEERVHDAIHEDADYYVTTQGVLGEPFLAIDPGSVDKPVVREGAIVKGIDPPRIDLFLAKAYELLDTTVTGIRNNKDLLSDLAKNTLDLLKGLNVLVGDNRDKIGRIVSGVEDLTVETNTLVRSARKNYVDSPHLLATTRHVETVSGALARDIEPLLRETKDTLANVRRTSATFGDPAQNARIQKGLAALLEILNHASQATRDAAAITAHIRQGKGTVGALLMDEEIYDDVQELVRDLKHNPWKFLWKE